MVLLYVVLIPLNMSIHGYLVDVMLLLMSEARREAEKMHMTRTLKSSGNVSEPFGGDGTFKLERALYDTKLLFQLNSGVRWG